MNSQNQTPNPFGNQLRRWRKARGVSQLDLAAMAQTTPRHLSFIETGRSRPGRDVILRIANCLNLPIRATNDLLVAAGLSPSFPQRNLEDEAMLPIRSAIQAMLRSHEPYPGCAIDAQGRIHLANAPYLQIVPNALSLSAQENVDAFYGTKNRQRIENWAEVVWSAYDLRNEFAQRSGDPELLRLANRALTHIKDIPRPPYDEHNSPVVCTRVRYGSEIISGFASTLRFDTASDITASELRIELIFPADEHSAELMRQYLSP